VCRRSVPISRLTSSGPPHKPGTRDFSHYNGREYPGFPQTQNIHRKPRSAIVDEFTTYSPTLDNISHLIGEQPAGSPAGVILAIWTRKESGSRLRQFGFRPSVIEFDILSCLD